jgi:acyl transferase domain-containing protein
MTCGSLGARDVRAFWDNLRDGIESIAFFFDAEMLDSWVSHDILANPAYMKAAPLLDGFNEFDASFFSYSSREAQFMDPQHRLLLEIAWEAFEDAGYSPESHEGVQTSSGAQFIRQWCTRAFFSN